ncbi:speriolin-like [Rhinoderma darwinii]|uniref:speriolin-like n=1 Tax=Rhinoderma darwinii TaxID=43563 RepID=UPI003F6786CB
MSSEDSGNNTLDKTLDIPNTSDDIDTLTAESARVGTENTELRKLMGLMQENVKLRSNLRDHERRAQSLPPPGQQWTDPKEMKEKKQPEGFQHPYTEDEAQVNNSHPHPDIKDKTQELDSCPFVDPVKVQQCQRIAGEIAFQLDRRILCNVFLKQKRLYGYRVANIEEKILQVTTCPATGKIADNLRSELNLRYHHTMDQLKKLGYDPTVHPYFTEYLVNNYGIKERTDGAEVPSSFNDPQFLGKMIMENMASDNVKEILVILNCLANLAKEDGKALFIW